MVVWVGGLREPMGWVQLAWAREPYWWEPIGWWEWLRLAGVPEVLQAVLWAGGGELVS